MGASSRSATQYWRKSSIRVWETDTEKSSVRSSRYKTTTCRQPSPGTANSWRPGAGPSAATTWAPRKRPPAGEPSALGVAGKEAAALSSRKTASTARFRTGQPKHRRENGNGTIELWELATAKRGALTDGQGQGAALLFAPDGRNAYRSHSRGVSGAVWDLATGKRLSTEEGPKSVIDRSPFYDGRQTAGLGHVRTGRLHLGRRQRQTLTPDDGHTSVIGPSPSSTAAAPSPRSPPRHPDPVGPADRQGTAAGRVQRR